MAFDLDRLCGYSTQRITKIQDRRLGFLYYAFILGIMGYILGYELLAQQSYKREGVVMGTARLQLKSPEAKFDDKDSAGLEYCGTSGRYASPLNADDTERRLPCYFWEEYDAVYPPLESGLSFLTTRITEMQTEIDSSCKGFDKPECSYKLVGETDHYVGNSEYFTLLIDHTMSAPSLDIARSSIKMEGRLQDLDGNNFDPCDDYPDGACPSYIAVGQTRKPDIVPIQTLLRAAHVDTLDRPSATTGPLADEFVRYAGMVLVLEIVYDNYYTFDPDKMRYTYRVSAIPDAEFKSEQPLPASGSIEEKRTVLNRHGIRIVVTQTGKIGKFEFQAMLLALVSSLGLLAVAKLVVDMVAVNCMPDRKLYAQYKVQQTMDFSDYHAKKTAEGGQDIELVESPISDAHAPTMNTMNDTSDWSAAAHQA